VVADARLALERGIITPVLKWVRQEDEGEITAAFTEALKVRRLSPEGRALADRYFFEALVRVHRAGEGAPYTGLKPHGTDPGPAIGAADAALAGGSVDQLVSMLSGHVADGLHSRFDRTLDSRKRAEDSVEAGRAFVAAYVDFMHYVEALHGAVEGGPHGEPSAPGEKSGTHRDRHP
jgi:hypothetical protein